MDLFDWIYVEEGPLLLFKMGPVKSLTLGRYMPTPLAVSIRGWGVGVITILKQTPPPLKHLKEKCFMFGMSVAAYKKHD